MMALKTEEEIQALADGLTELANALHDRLIGAIKSGEVDQATAQSVFQREGMVRQKANALYAEAAACVISGLAIEQGDLLGVVDKAKDQIKAIEKIRTALELVGDIVLLGASVITGKPGPILAALKEVKDDLDRSP